MASKRAPAGHSAPFGLQYLGVGNEDKQTDGFGERFRMIYEAIQAKHPEITVVGTVGPARYWDNSISPGLQSGKGTWDANTTSAWSGSASGSNHVNDRYRQPDQLMTFLQSF